MKLHEWLVKQTGDEDEAGLTLEGLTSMLWEIEERLLRLERAVVRLQRPWWRRVLLRRRGDDES